MKKLISLFTLSFCFLFLAVNADAQVTTNSGSGLNPTYPSLADAITALNGATITSPVVITLTGNETAPAGGYAITQLGGTSTNTITIEGVTSTITAFTPQATGGTVSSFDAVFKIIGGDWITIQAFTMNENTGNIVITPGTTNTMTEFGVLLVHATAIDGAQNNTVQNNTISLNSTYTNSVGIFSTSSSSPVNASLDATSTAGTNSNNKIYGNSISNTAQGILFICPPITATIFETGNDIGGTSGSTANTVTFGNAVASSGPWNRSQSTVQAGIYFRNGAGNSVRFNSVTSNSATYVGSGGLNGIMVSSGTAPSGVTYTTTISDNTVALTTTGTALMTGIDFGHGIATGTIVGSNNNVTLNQTSAAAVSAAIIGIKANYSSASNTANANTVTINQSNSVGATTSAVTGITCAGAPVTSINVTNSPNITIKQSVSGTGSFGAGAITFIDVNGVTTNTAVIANATGNNINTTGSAILSTGTLTGINQNTTIGLFNCKSNICNINRTAASGTATFTVTSTSPSEVADTISSNNITFTGLTGTSVVTAIASGGGPTSPVINNKRINNNTINISGTHTGTSIGITSSFTNTGQFTNNSITISCASPTVTGFTTSSTAATVSGNTLNLTSSTTSPTSMTGITVSGTGAHSITSNVFSAMNFTGVITGAPVVSGIVCSGNLGANIFGNVVTNITVGAAASTANPIVDGILLSGGTSVNVFKNKIYGITSNCTGATGVVNGIRISGGGTSGNNIYNNLIGVLSAAAATNTDAVRGISITSTTTTTTHNLYYNTVYLSGSGGTNFGSTGIFHTASTVATTSALNLRNNIVVNNTTPNGTGLAVSYRRSSGLINTLNNYVSTSNNNLFFTGVLSGSANQLIYSDGTSIAQTLAAYKGGVFTAGTIAPRDGISVTENPNFLSTTGSSVNFLHIDSLIATLIESGAATVVTPPITDDYDGIARYPNSGYPNNISFPATAPDIGADEIGGIPIDIFGPVISYTALTNSSNLVSNNLTATITDVSGVDVGANLPRLYYKKSTDGAYVFDNAPTGTPPSYTWTINYSLVGGGSVAPGDIIQYYVAAQDINGFVTTNPAGGSGSNPPGTTAPLTPNTYTIVAAPLAGDYTVGTTLFNRITGKNITFERVVKKVMVEVSENETVFENKKTESDNLNSDAISNVFVKDEISKVIEKKVMKEVEEVSWIPMENGKVYDGPVYVKRIDDPNLPDEAMAGAYLTITAAIADLNLRGASAAVRFLLIDGNYDAGETYPIVISPWVGNSATNNLTIQPNTSITTVISGSNATALFDVNGADYVTFNGSNSSSTSKDMTIRNTNTAGPAIRFINDATTDTVKNCIVESGNTSTTSGTILFSTSTGTLGNSSDVIENCDIRDRSDAAGVPANGVYSSGTGAAPNGSNKISGCNVFNWTNAGVLVTSTGAGNGWTINPSSFYQTAARTTAMIGISIQGGSGHSILNNSIGGTAPNAGGSFLVTSSTFRGIDLTVGTASATSVQGNTVKNIRSTTSSFTASYGIFLQAGLANIGNVSGNTIGSTLASERYEINGDSYGIRVASSSGANVNNNVINNFTTSPTVPTGEYYFGISIEGSGSHIVLNNTVTNLKNGSVPDGSFNTQTIGMTITATGVLTIRGNTISDMGTTSSAPVVTATTNHRVWGMVLSGSAIGTVAEKNKISNVYGSSTTTGARADVITCLQLQSSANASVSNNVISTEGGLSASDRFIYGILDISGATASYFYNSVNIYGISNPIAGNLTYAFNRNAVTTVNIRNNVFSNSRVVGLGANIAMANSNAAATGWSATASNYNALYTIDPGTLAQWLASVYTLGGFKAASGGDSYTYNGNPGFTTTTDLTPNPANVNCWIPNGNGIALSSISTDINGNSRSTTIAGGGTDIGAYEFTPSVAPSVISVAPSVSPLAVSNFILGEEIVASINLISGSVSNVDMQYYSGTVPPGLPGSPPVTDGYGNVYWDFVPSSTGFTYDLTIHFSPALIGTINIPLANIQVAIEDPPGNNQGFYTPYPQGTGTGQSDISDLANYNITVKGLSTMGKFIITDANGALPVELASFVSTINGRNVTLNWATSSEENNSGFDVERSSVNGSWSKIGNVAGNGTTPNGHSYSITDRNLASGNYNYRLKQIDFNGNFKYYNLSSEVIIGVPEKYELSQNYPNPFNPSTKISYDIPFDGKVSLTVFDISGKEVGNLVNEVKTAGYYTVNFNASNLSSGTYFYRLNAEGNGQNFVSTKKMMLLK